MSDLTPDDIKKNMHQKMTASLDALKKEFSVIRAGRATPAILESVKIDCYGTPTPLNQVAAISVPDPKTLLINPWDKKVIKEIERAILRLNLGLNVSHDGNLMRATLPPLTEENRKEYVRKAKKMGEDAKVAIRNIRRDANDHLKKIEKDKLVGQDEAKRALDASQKETDQFIQLIDTVVAQKEQELMTV